MNKTKYNWVVLTTDDYNYTIHDIEVVGIYKHKKYAEKIAKSLPVSAIRRVPVIEEITNKASK